MKETKKEYYNNIAADIETRVVVTDEKIGNHADVVKAFVQHDFAKDYLLADFKIAIQIIRDKSFAYDNE